jgi:hypothetical protein
MCTPLLYPSLGCLNFAGKGCAAILHACPPGLLPGPAAEPALLCVPLPLQIIARNLPPEEIEGLRAQFQSIDQDRSGTVTVDELRSFLRRKHNWIPENELQVGPQEERCCLLGDAG